MYDNKKFSKSLIEEVIGDIFNSRINTKPIKMHVSFPTKKSATKTLNVFGYYSNNVELNRWYYFPEDLKYFKKKENV